MNGKQLYKQYRKSGLSSQTLVSWKKLPIVAQISYNALADFIECFVSEDAYSEGYQAAQADMHDAIEKL